MAALVRLQMRWERTSGIAADDQTNTVYAYADGVTAPDLAGAWVSAWQSFTAGYREHVSAALFTGKIDYTVWDMADAEPRVPIMIATDTAACTGGGAILPEEVAMCLSFQAERLAGAPQARRRGRIYLPTPANEVVVAGGYMRFDTTFVDLVTELASGVKGTIEGSDAAWAVFSPTIYAVAHSIADAHSLVQSGWIDVEPDTQRRRGAKAGVKRPWS